jgi:hypothetical protein
MHSNFLLGSLRITEPAKMSLKRIPYDLIARHAVNDHGRVTNRELRLNSMSMKTAGQIVSRFPIDPRDTSLGFVMVVTHESWDETLVKLESE